MEWWFWLVFGVVLVFGFVVARGAPYVPSHRKYVQLALSELYHLTSKDVLVDLGSGDGIVLRLAAARGARAIGYELNPVLVLISKLLARGNGRITTKVADFWLVDLPKETTVVYAFAVSRDIAKLEKKMQQTATANGHALWLITYGAKPKTLQPVSELHAHTLYKFEP